VLFQIVNLTLLVASIGSGSGGQLAGARLLYGMGRDGALPRGFFGFVDANNQVPRYNVMLIGALCLGGAFVLSYQLGAELLNFGAFIGFMGVNLAAFLRYFIRGHRNLVNFFAPLLGFTICFLIWLNLRTPAKIAGACWLAFGMAYGAWRTRGFREPIRFEATSVE
jgi:amino acid transporter